MDDTTLSQGTPPDGEGGSSSSSSVTYSAAESITSATTESGQTYTSSTADENALLVSLASGTVNLTTPTVTKNGDSDGGDNCNFYGINSGVIAMGGGTLSITGGTVTADAKGANGIFSYGGNGGQNGVEGDGTTIYISGTTINTTGDNGGGIMTTGGGKTVAKNLTITTTGQSSAPIRTDRGGGTVSVNGGTYTSSGLGSPAIYSTAKITVESAALTSNKSEGVCIEGQNSVTLTECTLNASNTQTNGNAQFLDAVILYQSQSGDAADGTASFQMSGGELVNTSGHLFHVTNTEAVINLSGVTITDTGAGVLLSVCDDGWSGASNIATLNASGQILSGDILVADDSTLTLNISDSSTFTGKISGSITNASGDTISTSVGTVNVSLDSSSKWYLEEDTYITSFEGTAANVITGSHYLYVNNSVLSGTSETDGEDTTPSALNITNATNSTLIEGSSLADTISNSGISVTIDGAAGDDTISNTGANSSLVGGDGADSIVNNADSVTISGGASDDKISLGSSAENVLIQYAAGDGSDSIYGLGTTDTLKISGGKYSSAVSGSDIVLTVGTEKIFIKDSSTVSFNIDGTLSSDSSSTATTSGALTLANTTGNTLITGSKYADSITNSGANVTIQALGGKDILSNDGANVTIDAGDGNDFVFNEGADVSIFGGKGSDTIANSGDKATLTGGTGNDTFVYAMGEILISDYGTGSDKIILFGASFEDVATSDDDLIFVFGDGDSLTIAGGVDEKISFAGTDTTTYRFTDHAFMNSGKTSATLTSAATEFSAANFSKLITIDASAVDNKIFVTGNDKANKIYAGDSGSTLNGGKGKDTLKGGNGADIFVHETTGGSDVIVNYSSGDMLSIVGGAVTDSSVKSNGDAVLKIGDDKITVKSASGTEITISEDGTTKFLSGGVIYNSAKTSATLPASFKSTGAVEFANSVTNIDASSAKKAVNVTAGNSGATILGGLGKDTLTGGTGNDSIYGGKGNDSLLGGDGNDTLNGGKGNDSLWGGDGTDTFLYTVGTGTDTICDYASGELLQLLDADGDATTFTKATFSNSKLTLNVDGGGKVVFSNITDATTFNINNTNYTISGKTLEQTT